MKTSFLLLMLLFVMPCVAQEKCGLGLKDAPPIFGLSLGMNPKQAQSVLGKKLKVKVKKEGTFFQNFITKPPPAFLSGVRAVYLRFFNRQLYQIEIFYEADEERVNLDEFVGALSANLKLPRASWTESNKRFELDCAEFSLVADNVLNPRIELTDEINRAKFVESQQRKNKKK